MSLSAEAKETIDAIEDIARRLHARVDLNKLPPSVNAILLASAVVLEVVAETLKESDNDN